MADARARLSRPAPRGARAPAQTEVARPEVLFDFAFARTTRQFAHATCTITLRIWPRQPTRPIRLYWRSSKLTGLRALGDLVDTALTGYRSSDPALYAKMTTCTTSLLTKLPPPT